VSERNVEIAKQALVAFNAGDWERAESFYWPDAEAKAPEGWPEAEDSQGWPAIRRQFERLKDSWSEDHYELRSAEAVDGSRVFQYGIWRIRGHGSGIEGEIETWIVSTIRDGKISRIEFFLDEGQAKRAAGTS
jgi:ketosteroid isomerase-like protein